MSLPEGYVPLRTAGGDMGRGENQFMKWIEDFHSYLLKYADPGETAMKVIGDIAEAVGYHRPKINEKKGDYLNALRPFVEAYSEKNK